MRELDQAALERAAKAAREAVRPYQAWSNALANLEWEEMQEVYQRPYRMMAQAAITAFLDAQPQGDGG